jgi:hypothetical protein
MKECSRPFRHWIDDAPRLPCDLSAAARAFPAAEWPGWIRYESPFETRKRTCEDPVVMPAACAELVRHLQSFDFIAQLGELTGIDGLMSDPMLRGGGLHAMDPGGRLDVHLDYAIHPKLFLERRLNLILFLSERWVPEWKGGLELWNGSASRVVTRIDPKFGRMLLFECGDESYHGVTEPVACPAGECRKSVAVYYLTPPRGRRRALFVPTRRHQAS